MRTAATHAGASDQHLLPLQICAVFLADHILQGDTHIWLSLKSLSRAQGRCNAVQRVRGCSRVTVVEQLQISGLGVALKWSPVCWARVTGEERSPVPVPHPVVIHVDPAVQMSHVSASSCSGFA